MLRDQALLNARALFFGSDEEYHRRMRVAIELVRDCEGDGHGEIDLTGKWGKDWEGSLLKEWQEVKAIELVKLDASSVRTPPTDHRGVRFTPEFLRLVEDERRLKSSRFLPLPSLAYEERKRKTNDGPDKWEEHPSYGVITLHKAMGDGHLFGSNFRHGTAIEVNVHEASRKWQLSKYWVSPGRVLLRLRMTPAQWGNFLSSMSDGGGTPVTLVYAQPHGSIEPCPYSPKVKSYKAEMQRKAQKSTEFLTEAMKKLHELIQPGKSISKAAANEAVALVEKAQKNLTDGLPFLQGEYMEAMEGVVNDAKAEIDALVMEAQQKVGKEALAAVAGEKPLMLPAPTDDPPIWPDIETCAKEDGDLPDEE